MKQSNLDSMNKAAKVMTFSIHTLGCKLNQAEQDEMIDNMVKNGFLYTPDNYRADIIIINSCTVTNRARYKSLSTIRRVKRENPEALIVLAGCVPQTEPDIVGQGIDLALNNIDKVNIADILKKSVSCRTSYKEEIKPYNKRSRANLIIQKGCDSSCSYCIIPQARGKGESVPESNIIQNAQKAINEGYKEIVLTGIHISRYRSSGQIRVIRPLEDLLKKMLNIEGPFRIRLSSIEPADIDEQFVDFLLSNDRICRHLHIPLQHTEDNILKLMNRSYDKKYLNRLLAMIYNKSENIQIGSDFIVGFPSETDEDFERMCNTIKNLPISHFHVFPFSRRNNTKACHFPEQVTNKTKKDRSKKLQKLGEEKKIQFLRSQIGKEQTIIVLQGNGRGEYQVLSDNYISGYLHSDRFFPAGCLIKGKLFELSNDKAWFNQIKDRAFS